MKHKHADLIKAWADGAVIQYKELPTWTEWCDCVDNRPIWSETTLYRIKPSPKEVTFWFYCYEGDAYPYIYTSKQNHHKGSVEYKKTITLTEDDKI